MSTIKVLKKDVITLKKMQCYPYIYEMEVASLSNMIYLVSGCEEKLFRLF